MVIECEYKKSSALAGCATQGPEPGSGAGWSGWRLGVISILSSEGAGSERAGQGQWERLDHTIFLPNPKTRSLCSQPKQKLPWPPGPSWRSFGQSRCGHTTEGRHLRALAPRRSSVGLHTNIMLSQCQPGEGSSWQACTITILITV